MAAESHCRRGGSRSGSLSNQTPSKEEPPHRENVRQWSEPLPEVLNLISKKLLDLPDLVRFRAVCHRWRSAVCLSEPLPQLPCLVNDCWDSEYLENNDPQKYLCLYSMYSGPIAKIKVPVSYCIELMGSVHRYMLALHWDQSLLSLVNPLTRRQISLPPLNLDCC